VYRQITVRPGDDFSRLLGSHQWTGGNYVQGFNDLQQARGGFLHLSLSSLGERPARVILPRSSESFGILGDTMSDDQQLHACRRKGCSLLFRSLRKPILRFNASPVGASTSIRYTTISIL
jgi:hypothetical protein